jgi:hypothetical protein
MVRPKDAKVWNEDLVKALRARQEQCVQQGSKAQYTWRDGTNAIEEVRGDIYQFSSGRIVNWPINKLTKTVEEEARGIINGTRPIFPEGYIPNTLEERLMVPKGNPYDNDPYLKNIKSRGGAYSILMAFNFSLNKTMNKDQICAAAQPHCDEEMKENFHAGRTYGAWSSKQTLRKHGLIQENRVGGRASAGGASTTWTLTENGKLFTQALLRKFPQADLPGDNDHSDYSARVVTPGGLHSIFGVASSVQTTGGETFSFPVKISPAASAPTTKTKSGHTELFKNDEKELIEWLSATTGAYRQIKFKVGTARRENLQSICDTLMEQHPGLSLQRKTDGGGVHRALYISLAHQPASMSITRSLFHDKSPAPFIKTSPSKRFSGNDHGSDTPPKKIRNAPVSQFATSLSTNPKPSAARSLFSRDMSAFELPSSSDSDNDDDLKAAASLHRTTRQTPLTSLSPDSDNDNRKPASKAYIKYGHLRASSITKFLESDSESDEGVKPAAQSRDRKAMPQSKSSRKWPDSCDTDKKRVTKSEPVVLDLCSTDEDSDDDSDHRNRVAHSKNAKTCENDVVEIVESRESVVEVISSIEILPQLTVLIDNRERNRNQTPREMRIELTRHMTSGSVSAVWPNGMPLAHVEESQLSYGDFLFELGKGHGRKRLNLSIERKRVNDIASRSSKGDHWKQLQRMIDCCKHAVLLIEGDSRTISQFTAYGSQSQEGWNPDYHKIDDERSLFRFMGRALLSSRAIKFVQAKDEQASYRAVGTFGLVAAMYDSPPISPIDPPSAKVAVNKLYERLLTRGVPWKLARRVAEEVGSINRLQLLYSECDASCRKQLLSPLISNTCATFYEYGSVKSWSTAIYDAFHSCLADPPNGRIWLEEYKHFVEDHAKLLSSFHAGVKPEVAVQAVNDAVVDANLELRRVRIEASSELSGCLPRSTSDDDAFYKLQTVEGNPLGLLIPTIVMQTTSGSFRSARLFLHVIEAKTMIETIVQVMQSNPNNFVGAARKISTEIHNYCLHGKMQLDKDRRIFLVRGLQASIDAAAKRSGYRPELKVVVDMVFALLMIQYDIVVLQAVRLTKDLEMMVEELALACFHYQLLTQTT